MTYTAQQAKDLAVFVINSNGEVEETTLYDHVMESADETTSPRGVMTRIFVEEIEVEQFDEDGNETNPMTKWALKTWGVGGRGPAKIIYTFDTQEEAEDSRFQRTHDFDFMRDDQRDTWYGLTIEDAERELADRRE